MKRKVPEGSGGHEEQIISFQISKRKIVMERISHFPIDFAVLATQLCPILSDPMERSQPGSSVRGILQARI